MIDLKLMLPSYMLENERIREFVEVMEEVINDVISNIEDVNQLNQLWAEDKAIDVFLEEGFIRNFGLPGKFFELSNKSIYALVADWIKARGTSVFTEKLGWQLKAFIDQRDLSLDCLVWSKDPAWSIKVFQDGDYYREGSVSFRTIRPVTEEMNEILPVGVYWRRIYAEFARLIPCFLLLRFSFGFGIESRNEVRCSFTSFFSTPLYFPKICNLLLHSELTTHTMVINRNVIPLGVQPYRVVVNPNVIVL